MTTAIRESAKIIPIDARQSELAERVKRATDALGDGLHRTSFAPLSLLRFGETGAPTPSVYTPSLCIVVQGAKRVQMGADTLNYDPFNYLFVSVNVPVLGQVVEASVDRPYLCVKIDIDFREVARLLAETPAEVRPPHSTNERGMVVSRLSSEVVDVALRLVRLLDQPHDLPVLAPLTLRELFYRLLRGDAGQRLRNLVENESHAQRISRAIDLLQHRYAEPLRVEALAKAAHMSPSSFHAKFKAVTAMSPLQFQKQLRLHEARRAMLVDGLDASAAAFRVGYESASQFSREYRRLFGAPPRREVEQLRIR